MKNIKTLASFKTKTISKCIAFSLLMIASSQASALSINLCAGETEKTMPDGKVVKVWGYGRDNVPQDLVDGTCSNVEVPGPQITVPEADLDLKIMLRNTLDVPVSIIIPGMKATSANTPVFFPDGTFYNDAANTPRQRVRSFATETAKGASTEYSFVAKPGTHMYQSGTHPAVQVQMGLYGATVQNSVGGEAYPGVSYDNEVVMFYSEIDPAMHDAIAGATADDPGTTTVDETLATYGTSGPTSTIGYKARYYLVNGESYTDTTANIPVGDVGQRTLIRFLNAGLESHAPMLQSNHMDIVAEYGYKYPFARTQYSMLLAAGKTKDAIFTASAAGDYALYDRRLRLSNSAQAGDGGLMSILTVADAVVADPVITMPDTASTAEDTATTPAINVLVNDNAGAVPDATTVQIAAQPTNGFAVAEATGEVTYTPNTDFNGVDTFSYTVRNSTGDISNVATVTVTVTPVNDAPVAVVDNYDVTVGTVLNDNVLTNDIDIDTAALTASIELTDTAPTLGSVALNADGSFAYTAGAVTGKDVFTYTVSDGGFTATGTVNVTVAAAVNIPPVAVDDYASVTVNTGASNNFASINVSTNDTDADGEVMPLTVVIDANPLKGTAVVDATTGMITYTPKAGFRGSDAFSYTINDNEGATSNSATVRIDVIK